MDNSEVARKLEEIGSILSQQGANPFRVRAYLDAAETVRHLDRPLRAILEERGLEGLHDLANIGWGLARAIRELVMTGRLPMLDGLRGEADPEAILRTVPGVGRVLTERLHHELGISSLEDLELAAHDSRLSGIEGIGDKKLAAIKDVLAARLGRLRRRRGSAEDEPPVEELLDVDNEYRTQAAMGRLWKIAPRRFNPEGEAWLPVLHTERGDRHYTALYSNTARAHRLGKTDDWVVLYYDGGRDEGQATVVTETRGPLEGKRVVRGRESECRRFYRESRLDGGEPAKQGVGGGG